MLTLVAACSTDPGGVAGPSATGTSAPRFAAIPSSAVVIAAGSDNGAFAAADLVTGQSGPAFWANESADGFQYTGVGSGFVRPSPMYNCNIGYFGTSGLSTACLNEQGVTPPWNGGSQGTTGSSYANFLARTGLPYARSWGRNGASTVAAAFVFAGGRSYDLTVVGSYTREASEIGYFYSDNGTRKYVPISNAVNATVTIPLDATKGGAWGLYIKNAFNPSMLGCAPNTYCSDATGGFSRMGLNGANQQFALFKKADDSGYLIGMEDNKLELLAGPLPNTPGYTGYDADYNDYILSLAARGGDGCSPGFWKNAQASNWALAGYARGTSFSSAFAGSTAFGNLTLEQVLDLNGGGLNALGRQAVAALLNASAMNGLPPADSYDLTPDDVIARFNAAGSPAARDALKDFFESLIDVNGRACPLNNGRSAR
jgi:hypothetical protein